MINETYELSFNELDQVSGGGTCNPVPGGTVCKDKRGTTITIGTDTAIFIDNKGGITTSAATYVP